MATIEEIRGIWSHDHSIDLDKAPAMETWAYNGTVQMAAQHIATLLAALDKAQAQIARDAPVLAAAEALHADIVQWPGYMPFLREEAKLTSLVVFTVAMAVHRAYSGTTEEG